MATTKCLVCFADCLKQNSDKGTIGGAQECSNSNLTEAKEFEIVHKHVQVIFLLRKMLEIPENMCCNFLEVHGDPSLWIACCESCLIIVRQGKGIFEEILSLQKKYKTVQTKLKSVMFESVKQKQVDVNEDVKCGINEVVRSYVAKAFESSTPTTPSNIKIEELLNSGERDDQNTFPVSSNIVDNSDELNSFEGIDSPEQLINEDSSDQYETEIEKDKKSKRRPRRQVSAINRAGESLEDPDYDDEPHKCGACNKQFPNETMLNDHFRLHLSEKPYVCEFCPKRFRDSCHLKDHIKTHTGERPFGCGLCGKKFSLSTNLTKHMKIHTGNRPFKCHDCGKHFLHRGNLNRHRCSAKSKTFIEVEPAIDAIITNASDDHERDDDDLANIIIKSEDEDMEQSDNRKHLNGLGTTGNAVRENPGYEENPYECKQCDKTFTTPGNRNKHMRIHTGEKPHECETCGKGFRDTSHLKDHLRTHTGEKPYQCKLCKRKFSLSTTLTKHMKIHSNSGLNEKCITETLNHLGKTETEMNEDQNSSNNNTAERGNKEGGFTCNICGRKCSTAGNLNKHLKIHTNEKPYKCGTCNKGFRDSSHLKDHLKTHTGEKSFVCGICEKRFAISTSLTKHAKVHRNTEKLFKCNTCGETFAKLRNLKDHMYEAHHFNVGGESSLDPIEEKMHKCSICEKEYPTIKSLNKHIRTHSDEKPFKCNVCGKSFKFASHLRDHTKIHTGEKTFVCDVCGKAFAFSTTLKKHSRCHSGEKPFQCETCGKYFSQSSNLKAHMVIHSGERPYQCEVCGKSFQFPKTLRSHARSHTGERRYKCDACGKAYTKSISLKKHRLKTNCGHVEQTLTLLN